MPQLPAEPALSDVAPCREETSDQAAVLHFTYNRFEDLKSRRDRCDCAPTEEDAKRCFILPFDRMVRLRSCSPHGALALMRPTPAVDTGWAAAHGLGPGSRIAACAHLGVCGRRRSWRRPCAATRS